VGLARTGPGYAEIDRTGQVTAFTAGGQAPRNVYAPGHVAIWSTKTNGHAGSVLKVQDDRNVVVYAPGNVSIWASNSGV
jgi:hypothetical protein